MKSMGSLGADSSAILGLLRRYARTLGSGTPILNLGLLGSGSTPVWKAEH